MRAVSSQPFVRKILVLAANAFWFLNGRCVLKSGLWDGLNIDEGRQAQAARRQRGRAMTKRMSISILLFYGGVFSHPALNQRNIKHILASFYF